MYKLILILLLSINISSNDLVLSFNQLINNNLSFIQTTDTGAEEVQSIGQIYKKEDVIGKDIEKGVVDSYSNDTVKSALEVNKNKGKLTHFQQYDDNNYRCTG